MSALTEKPATTARREAPWCCEVKVDLITRLFGGGVKAREIDPISWLRSSAAKSALRAWWRAGHAHMFGSLDALREREGEIFGSPGRFDDDGHPTGGPGALEVSVEKATRPPTEVYRGRPGEPLNVALFPAAGMGQPAAVLGMPRGTTVLLKLVSHSPDVEIHKEILTAFRLWITLGGAGARTRRGVGALAVSSEKDVLKLGIPSTLKELESFLFRHCRPQQVAPDLDGVFCLARTRQIYVASSFREAEGAQEKLLSALRKARQERRPTSPHQSNWPESDAIRLKTGTLGHPPLPGNAERYPRAVLGLPIILHFKDDAHPRREPADHQILAALPAGREWQKLERFASPILLRPVRIVQGRETRYVPVAIFTDSTLPTSARPLVMPKAQTAIGLGDVITSYDLQAHADATLRRIENVFVPEGFTSLPLQRS
jgi:CRISPR-associated protein Cmr1